jgi:hypothetical protein
MTPLKKVEFSPEETRPSGVTYVTMDVADSHGIPALRLV